MSIATSKTKVVKTPKLLKKRSRFSSIASKPTNPQSDKINDLANRTPQRSPSEHY